MRINWKVRFKNPVFIFQLILSIFMPILAYFGLTLDQLTSWPKLFHLLVEAIKNPYVVGLIIASVWNAVNDPTVAGIGDSRQALSYKKPRDDKKGCPTEEKEVNEMKAARKK